MTVSAWQSEVRDPFDADVVVVGAGISGLSMAYWLTQADPELRVVVLDRGRVGAGASGRNAGFLTSGSVAHFARQVDRHGEELAWTMWSLSRDNHALLREHILDAGSCGYRPAGALSLLRDPARTDAYASAAERLAARGAPVRAVPIAELGLVAQSYASPGGSSWAWLVEDDALVDPVALLGQLLARCGATLYREHPVQTIATTPHGVEVETPELGFRAQHAVLATNAYAHELVPELSRYLQPVRGQCLQTHPIAHRLDRCVYATDDWLYLRQLEDGSIVAGGRRPVDAEGELGTDDRLNPHVQRAIDETLVERFGALFDGGAPKVTRRWSGALAYAHRGRPFADAVPGRPGLWALGGYGGHGMGLGFVAARHLAARILGGAGSPVFDLGTH